MLNDQGQLWPSRPQLIESEVLSSWLSRIASAHGLSYYDFLKVVMAESVPQNFDLDRVGDQSVLDLAGRHTATSPESIWNSTLIADEGRIFSQAPPETADWIVPIVLRHSRSATHTLPCCPICLNRDAQPFYRKHWRYAFYAICPEHGLLRNDCPHCGHPYSYLTADRLRSTNTCSGTIGHCRGCGSNFSGTGPLDIPDQVLNAALEVQMQITRALDSNWIEIGDKGPVHVCMYLRGLHLLTEMFRRPRTGRQIADFLGSHCQLGMVNGIRINRKIPIEAQPTLVRAQILALVGWLVGDWPSRLTFMCKSLALSPSQILASDRPAWMFGPSIDELNRGFGKAREGQLQAAKVALTNTMKWPPSSSALRKYITTGQLSSIKPLRRPASVEFNPELWRDVDADRRVATARREAARMERQRPKELYPPIESAVAQAEDADMVEASHDSDGIRHLLRTLNKSRSRQDDH